MPKKVIDPVEAALARVKKRSAPLWKGPEEDGVTFSLLSKFLICRERFRLLVVEGLKASEQFPHKLEYGNMWHACEEGLAAQSAASARNYTGWEVKLRDYARSLMQRYPHDREAVQHWYQVCRLQFPEYIKYWADHPDNAKRTPLLQEQVFSVLYKLPSGRTVKLRGKWDSVDLIGEQGGAGVFLQENKTKGDIYEPQMRRQLKFDLQTMIYLVALSESATCDVSSYSTIDVPPKGMYTRRHGTEHYPIKGVRYNVVRRPLSGGKGTIKQHGPTKKNPLGESKEEYYGRLRAIIADDPAHYFMRWTVEVSARDVERFRRECLDPILEQLCDWWQWVTTTDPFRPDVGRLVKISGLHFRMPFGVYSPLLDGGATELDEYLETGSMVGLARTDNLFPELSDAVPT